MNYFPGFFLSFFKTIYGLETYVSHITSEGQRKRPYQEGKEKKDMGFTHAIDSLKGVLITIGTAIGAVMLVYGGIRFAIAFKQLDQQGEHQAIYTVVAGGILIGLGALVAILT